MLHCCRTFMEKNLFDRIKIKQTNAHFPPNYQSVTIKALALYDQKVLNAKCELQLLGLGINGHIGFNEPYCLNEGNSSINNLTQQTIKTKADYFYNGDQTKMTKQVVTVGINTILEFNNVVLCAFGNTKSAALGKLLGNESIIDKWPVQFLRHLPVLSVVTDRQCFNGIKTGLNVRLIKLKFVD